MRKSVLPRRRYAENMVQKAMAASGLASGRSWLSDSGTGPVAPGSCTHAHGYNLTVILGRVIWLDNP